MDVTQPNITTGPNVQPNAQTPAAPSSVINSDFETFLRMLTAQMQNQDPLNPIESSDFATQLATFSSVEQQVLTNDLLTAVGAQLGASNVSQLAGWVGMIGRAVMPVQFDGAPVQIATPGYENADRAVLVVTDSSGRVVTRTDISAQREEFEWVGSEEDGTPLPSGEYHLTVEYFAGEQFLDSAFVSVEARIVEARNDNGSPVLVMDTGQEVLADQVLGLKETG